MFSNSDFKTLIFSLAVNIWPSICFVVFLIIAVDKIKKTDFYNFDTDVEEQFRNYIEIENYGDKL